MSEAILEKFILNNEIYSIEDFNNKYIENSPTVYEVIRIIDSVPLFLERHYERLINSANLLGYKINVSFETLEENIHKMIEINKIQNYNIKIIINNFSAPKQSIYYYFIKSEYPNDMLYSTGINAITFRGTRDNPNAKVIYKSMRAEINALLAETNCYEAILVNNANEVTEGSRSNLFFVKDNRVYTAPAGDVLLGITRQSIIALCKNNNIEVIEKNIVVNDIYEFEGCFISGTSPKVLKINKIDNHIYQKINVIIDEIISKYNLEIEKYISSHK